MQPRVCKFFLISLLLFQSIVIIWLVHDLLEVNSNGGYETKDGIRIVHLETHQDPAHVRPPLTVRDLKAQEVEETEKPQNTAPPSTKPSTKPPQQPTKTPQQPTTHKQVSRGKPTYDKKGHLKEQLIESIHRPSRPFTDSEAAGNNIMITVRTTRKFHQRRLPYMYDTWLTAVNGSNVFLVTDAEDEEYEEKSKQLGIHYEIISCGQDYGRWSLCCKSGEEMALMYRPENMRYNWFCHLDDDIYLNLKNLVKLFLNFDPLTEPIYMGRAGNNLNKPLSLSKKQKMIKDESRKFSFAVGGMYCLSRAMLDKVKPWLIGGHTMGATCDKLLEPEDVTVGATVELLANQTLSRTKLFHPHGLILSKFVNPRTLKDQIGFAYGCGQLCNFKVYKNNAVKVPHAKFPFKQDPSRFKSLHCHLYPNAPLCKSF